MPVLVGVVVTVVVPDVVPVVVPVTVEEVVGVVVCVDVGDDVPVVDVVAVVVGVVVVVSVEVWVVVVVAEDVGVVVVVAVDVGVVVSELVTVVVGVVTSHPWNPPRWNASVIVFSVATNAPQLVDGTASPLPKHVTSAGDPSGPRNSVAAAATESASAWHVVALLLPSSLTTVSATPNETTHVAVPGALDGHAPSTRFSNVTWAEQLELDEVGATFKLKLILVPKEWH